MGPWLEILPSDPWLLTAVGILGGIMGIPLTPWWAWLGFRCGWQEGFALGWISALAAMTGHFLAFRMAGEKLRQTTWLGLKIQRFQPRQGAKLSRCGKRNGLRAICGDAQQIALVDAELQSGSAVRYVERKCGDSNTARCSAAAMRRRYRVRKCAQ